jgi:hypothetical protein
VLLDAMANNLRNPPRHCKSEPQSFENALSLQLSRQYILSVLSLSCRSPHLDAAFVSQRPRSRVFARPTSSTSSPYLVLPVPFASFHVFLLNSYLRLYFILR